MHRLHPQGELTAPLLLVSFDGWVNAGSVGTATAEHLALDGEIVADFDSDALFDYRANRPVIDFVEGIMTQVTFPSVTLQRRRYEGRDLLILSGTEPNWNWQAFGGAVAELATTLGVVEYVSVGGIPSAVPHTRATPVVSTASRADLISAEQRLPMGLLRVPGAAVSVVEHFVVQRGIPAVGFWAQVPHYIGAVYYPGVVSLVEQIARHAGVAIPLGSLVDQAAEQRAELDALLAERPDAKAFIERLEALADAGDAASGEDIAAEIERFLAESGDDPFEA